MRTEKELRARKEELVIKAMDNIKNGRNWGNTKAQYWIQVINWVLEK